MINAPSKAPATEYSVEFLQGMVDRMAMSYFKYGAVAEAKGKIDEIACLMARLAKYCGKRRLVEALALVPDVPGDGNTEWLMDVGNFSMIEFMQPSIQTAHFKATTEKESPGRVWAPDEFDGSVETSARTNDLGIQ
jgi:hypothetical protein